MLGPNPMSARALARETGISEATLSRWRQAAATMPEMPSRSTPKAKTTPRAQATTRPDGPRSGAEKFAVTARAAGLDGEALGEFCRREGIHLSDLEQWRRIAEDALAGGRRPLPPSKELRRVKADLARKEKALAETAALLVLKKKVEAIWGGGDDDTEESNE